MPSQMADLVKVILGAFTMAVTALKVPGFNTAARRHCKLNHNSIVGPSPAQFGCQCELNSGFMRQPARCFTLRRGTHMFSDKWMRYVIRVIIISVCARVAIAACRQYREHSHRCRMQRGDLRHRSCCAACVWCRGSASYGGFWVLHAVRLLKQFVLPKYDKENLLIPSVPHYFARSGSPEASRRHSILLTDLQKS